MKDALYTYSNKLMLKPRLKGGLAFWYVNACRQSASRSVTRCANGVIGEFPMAVSPFKRKKFLHEQGHSPLGLFCAIRSLVLSHRAVMHLLTYHVAVIPRGEPEVQVL